MASQLELSSCPTAPDCISWSKDNLIAVAGGDIITLLVPRLKDSDQNGKLWDNLNFAVNAFTAEEVPIAESLSFKNFSVGEEQSHRHVQALAWSSPGLGKRKYETSEQFDERLQVAQRVRAFAWGPHHNFVVATEADEIVLLRVTSPYDILTPGPQQWRVDVAGSFSSATLAVNQLRAHIYDTEKVDENTRALAEVTRVADHIAWSAAETAESPASRSTIAFISQGRLFCAAVEGSSQSDDSKPSLIVLARHRFLHSHSDLTGPLRFVPDSRLLIAFGPDSEFCVDTVADPKDPSGHSSHHLDGRWDEVTGVAFTQTNSGASQLHITSMLSSSDAATAVLTLPFDKAESATAPAWQEALVNTKAAFGTQHKLGTNVLDRVWGLATSPLGDLMITATTLLPSHALSYVTENDQRTSINITREHRHDAILPTNGGTSLLSGVTSAVLLFSLKAHLAQQNTKTGSEVLVQAMLDCANGSASAVENLLADASRESIEPLEYARVLRARLATTPELMSARFKLLADFALEISTTADQIIKPVLQTVVGGILALPEQFSQAGELSSKIRKVYQVLDSRLHPGRAAASMDEEIQSWREECLICAAGIDFESTKWACCTNGHRFTRCGLTLLTMQRPGISKQCSICGMQFLDEWSLEALAQPQGDEDIVMTEETIEGNKADGTADKAWVHVSRSSTEREASLARILFAAFDKCIYCGGDF
ncbi:hypothetical protein LTR09_007459 [Extremus antarcticus]|uniref:Transcription factor IIIC 90kDa subunit N-terminal domain-containing protein n=1 Tax=Extremus antarcticus TaxID=702011 RepID=A0AAJ0DJK8_9PEZI|nr:hypothetical protein LTR09_007459 [Extremus antarcticus]